MDSGGDSQGLEVKQAMVNGEYAVGVTVSSGREHNFGDDEVSFILNLYSDGYSIVKASENDNGHTFQDGLNLLRPYDRTSRMGISRQLTSFHEKMRKDRLNRARGVSGVILAVRTLWFDSKLEVAVRFFNDEVFQTVFLGAAVPDISWMLKLMP